MEFTTPTLFTDSLSWGWFRSRAYHLHGKRLPNGSYNSIKKTSAMATIDRWYGRSIKESRVPLSHVLYNKISNQIVTVAQHSSVVKFGVSKTAISRQITTDSSISNGAKLFKDLNDITAVALIRGHRRLLLGTHKGNSVTVWNTNNCKCKSAT